MSFIVALVVMWIVLGTLGGIWDYRWTARSDRLRSATLRSLTRNRRVKGDRAM